VTRLAADNAQNVFGVEADSARILERAVDNGRNPATDADTPRFILAAALASFGCNYCFDSQLLISF
jgi:hypothetical protein